MSSSRVISWLFFLALALLVAVRVQVYLEINLVLIDSDQPFMWQGLRDYAEGRFYEPRYYAQNYNSFLEALIAVPFFKAGMPVYYALPLATHLLFLFPFVFLAVFLFIRQQRVQGLLVLLILLAMNSGYDVLSSIPRGFIGGLACCGLLIVSVINPGKKNLSLNGILIALGWYINPNCIFAIIPFAVLLAASKIPGRQFLYLIIPLIGSFIGFYFLFDYFYRIHPDYIMYGIEQKLSLKAFINSLLHIGERLYHISPFREGNIFLTALFLLGPLILLWPYKRLFAAHVCLLAAMVLSLFHDKAGDGSLWPFYSFSRLFIAVPFAIAFLCALIPVLPGKAIGLFAIPVFILAILKMLCFGQQVKKISEPSAWQGVHLVPLAKALESQKFYKEVCETQHCTYLLISPEFWLSTYLSYGGPAVDPEFPETMELEYDHRYWVREKLRNKRLSRFMLISVLNDLDKRTADPGFGLKPLDNYGLYLVHDNTLSIGEFAKRIRAMESRK
jgi:hypothetical protein